MVFSQVWSQTCDHKEGEEKQQFLFHLLGQSRSDRGWGWQQRLPRPPPDVAPEGWLFWGNGGRAWLPELGLECERFLLDPLSQAQSCLIFCASHCPVLGPSTLICQRPTLHLWCLLPIWPLRDTWLLSETSSASWLWPGQVCCLFFHRQHIKREEWAHWRVMSKSTGLAPEPAV